MGQQLSWLSSTRSLISIMMHQKCFSQHWPRIDDRQPVHSLLISPMRMKPTVPDRPGLACGVIPPRAMFHYRIENGQQLAH